MALLELIKNSLEVINVFCEKLDLIDAWRALNPDLLKFTWRQKKPEVHSRLNFFIVDQSIFCRTIKADTLPGYKTDHSMISIQISLHSNGRGRGFWKLNISFLTDTEYVNQIKSIILQTKEEYSEDETVDPSLLWEMVKMKVRESSIKFGASKKRKLTNEQEETEQSIANLERCLTNSYADNAQKQQLWSELKSMKHRLETIIEYQTKGAILTSKSRWYNEGEKKN